MIRVEQIQNDILDNFLNTDNILSSVFDIADGFSVLYLEKSKVFLFLRNPPGA